jgi:hypothetical protein
MPRGADYPALKDMIRRREVARKPFDCQAAISAMLSNDDKQVSRISAFFDFIGFIRYPEFPRYAVTLANIYDIIYIGELLKNKGKVIIDEVEFKSIIFECANILKKVLQIKINTVPFIMFGNDDHIVALIVRFLLSYRPRTSKITDRPSLRKAFYFIRSGGYKEQYTMNELKYAWATLKTVAAFHYVNLRHSRILDFRLHGEGFEHRAADLLNDHPRLARFFAESLWVQNRLRAILSPRVFRGATLPWSKSAL